MLFTIEAQQFRKVGLVRQAIEVCKRGLVYFPMHVTGYVVLAQAYRDLGQVDRAVNVLRDGFRRTGAVQLDQLRALLAGEVFDRMPDDVAVAAATGAMPFIPGVELSAAGIPMLERDLDEAATAIDNAIFGAASAHHVPAVEHALGSFSEVAGEDSPSQTLQETLEESTGAQTLTISQAAIVGMEMEEAEEVEVVEEILFEEESAAAPVEGASEPEISSMDLQSGEAVEEISVAVISPDLPLPAPLSENISAEETIGERVNMGASREAAALFELPGELPPADKAGDENPDGTLSPKQATASAPLPESEPSGQAAGDHAATEIATATDVISEGEVGNETPAPAATIEEPIVAEESPAAVATLLDAPSAPTADQGDSLQLPTEQAEKFIGHDLSEAGEMAAAEIPAPAIPGTPSTEIVEPPVPPEASLPTGGNRSDGPATAAPTPTQPAESGTGQQGTAGRSHLAIVHGPRDHHAGNRRSSHGGSAIPGALIGSEASLERERTLSLAFHPGHSRSRLRSSNLRLIPGLEFAPLRQEDHVRRQPIASLIGEPMPELTRSAREASHRPHQPEPIPLPVVEEAIAPPFAEGIAVGDRRPDEPAVEVPSTMEPEPAILEYFESVRSEEGAGDFDRDAFVGGEAETASAGGSEIPEQGTSGGESFEFSISQSGEREPAFPEPPGLSPELQRELGLAPRRRDVLAEIAAEPEKRQEGLTPLEELARRLEKARIPVVEEPIARETGAKGFEPTIVSETLANILLSQGAYSEALKAFRTLARTRADRSEYFDEKIRQIERRMADEEGG